MVDAEAESAPILLDRPEARSFKVEDLLAAVRDGKVRVPSFQRPLRWDRSDALKLLDSIYRGYPVGTLLLWESRADAGEVRFGSVHISAGPRSDAWWVVDGQQRLASMARVLLPTSPQVDDFSLYFDLDNGQLMRPPAESTRLADPARWLPMTEVLDSQRLIQWLLDHPDMARVRRDRAIQLGKRVREYDFPAYIVRTGSEQTLRDIFGRSNSTGKSLLPNEVFDALNGERASTHPATLSQVSSQLDSLDFGRVDEKVLYRLSNVLLGGDVVDRSGQGPRRLSVQEAAALYPRIAAAAAAAIQFLKRDVGVPRYELLPYKQPLVALGRFFDLHPQPSARSRDLLARWVWRGALDGSHKGDTVSTRRVLERIEAGAEEASVQRMLALVASEPVELPNAAEPFNFRHAAGKLQTLALVGLRPRDLESGDLVDPPADAPPAILTDRGVSEPLLESVVNRLAHPPRSGLRRTLLRVEDPRVLASHGIADEAIHALRKGRVDLFLDLRRAELDRHIAAFLRSRARWGEPDRPSLAALSVSDEEVV